MRGKIGSFPWYYFVVSKDEGCVESNVVRLKSTGNSGQDPFILNCCCHFEELPWLACYSIAKCEFAELIFLGVLNRTELTWYVSGVGDDDDKWSWACLMLAVGKESDWVTGVFDKLLLNPFINIFTPDLLMVFMASWNIRLHFKARQNSQTKFLSKLHL